MVSATTTARLVALLIASFILLHQPASARSRASEFAMQVVAQGPILPPLPAPPPPQPSAPMSWSGQLGGNLASQQTQRCQSVGAPPQWRPHLDAASKAHLAPTVALATLKHFNFAPIQLAGSTGGQASTTATNRFEPGAGSPPLLYQHAQSINNVGVLIEATFQVNNVLKLANRMAELRPRQTVRLLYKVSASLSTTSDIISLANGDNSTSKPIQQHHPSSKLLLQRASNTGQLLDSGEACALELSENELVKKGSRLFRIDQDYVLFLNQVPSVSRRLVQQQQQQQQQQNKRNQFETAWIQHALHPFASHEPLNKQTSKSIHKILCKNCAQAPQVQLLNGTQVSTGQNGETFGKSRKVRLDCRAFGNPNPWLEWFRNGKLLRNKPGRYQMKSGKLVSSGGRQWRTSRLEVELRAGRNETGIYECRAMNVAAREPVVGAYTLLILPELQFALVPMQDVEQAASISEPISPPPPRRPAQQVDPATAANSVVIVPEMQQPDSSREQQLPGATTNSAHLNNATSVLTTTTTTTSEQQQATSSNEKQANSNNNSNKSSPVVVGQPCPREAEEKFCLNRGTCVLIGHIEEYFCNCAEGYHGHRCEYKSLGHQQTKH